LLTRKNFASPRLRATANGPAQGSKPQTRAGRSQAAYSRRRRQCRSLKRYLVVPPASRAYLGC
jgi:hypothetical protein